MDVPLGGGGRRVSQEFSDLCEKFNVKEEEGVAKDAKLRLGKYLDCSFYVLPAVRLDR